MPDLFPTLFDHHTLWLSDMTLLTVFLVSTSDTTFLSLRSGIKYCSACVVTTYLKAAVGCDLNRSATVLLLFFVLHPLTANTTDNLFRRQRQILQCELDILFVQLSSPAINCCSCSLLSIQGEKKSSLLISCVKDSFILARQSTLLLYLRVYTPWFSTAYMWAKCSWQTRTRFFNAVLCTRQSSLGSWNNFCLNTSVKFLDSLINSRVLCSWKQL